MKNKDFRNHDAVELRKRAEKMVSSLSDNLETLSPETLETLSPEEIQRVFHELQVHQIELSMQNEELRRSQEEIDASRKKYFDIYDLAPVGYLTLSDKGHILEANLTATTLLGVPRGSLVGRLLSQFIFKEDQDIFYRHRKQLVETGDAQAFDLRMKKQGETVFWGHIKNVMACDEGTPVSRIVLSDITQRKQAEDDREMLQIQLTQAQKAKSVGRLAGGVAHDFNNMLSVIIGNTELALDIVETDHLIHELLMETMIAAKHSADIVRQLMGFACKQNIKPEVLNLNEVVQEMLKMRRNLISKDITLVLQAGGNLWNVDIDPSQMNQILLSLCDNARDAIVDTGKVVIKTENRTVDKDFCLSHGDALPGEYVRISVKDNGSGMDEEILTNLFEPFFTTKEVGKGIGLGLSTVYGIVKQNKGFLDVYSKPGRGTEFKIYLPRHQGKSSPEIKNASWVKSKHHGHETILLVDDSPSILRMVKIMLEKMGYGVLATDSPEKAICLIQKHTDDIHMLMTDVMMPKMNGWELYQKIMSIAPRIRCLFMSGYSANLISEHGAMEHQVNFIEKPFSISMLTVKINEVLEQYRSVS